MTEEELRQIARDLKQKHINGLDYENNDPITLQKHGNCMELLCNKLYSMLAANKGSSMDVMGIPVGFNLGGGGIFGLKAVPGLQGQLENILSRIANEEIGNMASEIAEQWKKHRIASGTLLPENKSAGDTFVHQKFQGFE